MRPRRRTAALFPILFRLHRQGYLGLPSKRAGNALFQDVAEYRIIDIGTVQPEADLIQLTLSEMAYLLPKGIFNNEARSAISLLLSLA